MSSDTKANLKFIAMSISSPARNALTASFVMHAADAFFQKYQTRFRTHPGSTYTYASLYATEALGIVEIAEIISNKKDPEEEKKTGKGDRFPLPIVVRGKEKLANHRDMVCHPTVVSWRGQNNQSFADAGHKWNDVRAGLVWDVQKQINEALVVHELEVYVDGIPATPEMGQLLRVILLSAGMTLTADETEKVFFRYFELQKDSFMATLEKYPDGIVPPQTL